MTAGPIDAGPIEAGPIDGLRSVVGPAARRVDGGREPATVPEPTLDEDRFAALYPALQRFAAATPDLDQDPADVVQEALVRYLRVARQQQIDEPLAYLRRTVLNLVIGHRRTAARRRAHPSPERGDEGRVDSYPSDADAILDQLGPTDRALLALTALDGLTSAEAAATLGLSPDAARARLSRAKHALRRGGAR